MSELKVGDIVQLKSGGPKMTVDRIFKDAFGAMAARCSWFEENKPMTQSFPLTSLNSA
jgi:uncharacterized protein YodC (DUF2158 family)